MGCFLGCGSGMLNWCMNIDQQHGEHCHSSCSTLAHDRGKNNAPTDLVVGKKGLVSSLPFSSGRLPPIMAISFSCNPTTTQEDALSLALPPRLRDVIYWARENISVMEWLDATGREVEDFHCLDFCVVASDSSPSISAVSPYE